MTRLAVNNTVIVPCSFNANDRSRQAAIFEDQTYCHQQCISLSAILGNRNRLATIKCDEIRNVALRRSLTSDVHAELDSSRACALQGVVAYLSVSVERFYDDATQEYRSLRKLLNRRDLFKPGTHLAAVRCDGIRIRQPRLEEPMKSILDQSFRYTKSVDTDLRKTFARVRREQRQQARTQVEGDDRRNVFPVRPHKHAAMS